MLSQNRPNRRLSLPRILLLDFSLVSSTTFPAYRLFESCPPACLPESLSLAPDSPCDSLLGHPTWVLLVSRCCPETHAFISCQTLQTRSSPWVYPWSKPVMTHVRATVSETLLSPTSVVSKQMTSCVKPSLVSPGGYHLFLCASAVYSLFHSNVFPLSTSSELLYVISLPCGMGLENKSSFTIT